MKITKIQLVALIAIITLMPSLANAQTLGDLLNRVSSQDTLINISSFIAYISGVLFASLGVHKLRQHSEFGPQKVELPEALKYLFAGGLMLSIPSIAGIAQATFGSQGGGQEINTLAWASGSTTDGSTLDGMMRLFVQDAYVPMQVLITFFCFAAGAMFLVVAIHRFTKTAQEGPRGPTGMGTIATFLLAGALFSIAPMIGMFTETMFGDRTSRTIVQFMAIDSGAAGYANANNVLTSVLAFLAIVGILSVVRGMFVLRGLAEGQQQATMMGGLSHIIAGAVLVNFGGFANIIQNTLGIGNFGIQFN